jgi:hypothetical protein
VGGYGEPLLLVSWSALTHLCLWAYGDDMCPCPVSLQFVGYFRALRSLELDFVNIGLHNDASAEAFVAAAPHLDAIHFEERTTQKRLVH